MIVTPIKTRIFLEGESIDSFLKECLPAVKEKMIVVVTSKIVALSESRTAPVGTKEEKAKLIASESEYSIETPLAYLTLKDGMLMAGAGVDESNANGKIVLLPKNSYVAAQKIREYLCSEYAVKDIGVILTDSKIMPLRAGVVGVALGYAGFKGLHDYRGAPDIFGRELKMTQVDVADSMATAAVFTMGEGGERQPVALIEGANVEFTDEVNEKELIVDPKIDLYAPLFQQLASSAPGEKNFNVWNVRKQRIHVSQKAPHFHEREIWWCSLGINVGHEQDGKGDNFERPVLVIKKFNRHIAWVVPLTTKAKSDTRFYIPLTHQSKKSWAVLSQLRLVSASRLNDPMLKVSERQFEKIIEGINRLFNTKAPR